MALPACSVIRQLDANLLGACSRVEAGFYFEEGGCYGMALAMYETLEKAGHTPGYGYSTAQGHAVVLASELVLDYTGICRRPADLQIVTEAQLREIAGEGGAGPDQLFSDKSWAEEAILCALV